MMNKKNTMQKSILEELQKAEAYQISHPVLQSSPGDLRKAGEDLSDYLSAFSLEDQKLYRDYYEDEM